MMDSERTRTTIFGGDHKNGNIMIRASKKDIRLLKEAAEKSGCTVSEFVRRSVNAYAGNVTASCPSE